MICYNHVDRDESVLFQRIITEFLFLFVSFCTLLPFLYQLLLTKKLLFIRKFLGIYTAMRLPFSLKLCGPMESDYIASMHVC